MKVILFITFVACAYASRLSAGNNHQLDAAWRQFKIKYNKAYDQSHETSRRLVWESNIGFIQKHNQEAAQGKHTFTLAENQFADMTNDEFHQAMNKYRPSKPTKNHNEKVTSFSDEYLPNLIDWRAKNMVTSVKNQQNCEASWIFAAIGAVEGAHSRATGELVSLSPQQLMDCFNIGAYPKPCEGGSTDDAFKYILKAGGVVSQKHYNYTAVPSYICRFDSRYVRASISGYVKVESGSEKELQRATASIGPVAVAIDASQKSFQFYSGGLYLDTKCSSTNLNHAALVVGYGTSSELDYWLVKNSWGPGWGEGGYIRMVRNHDNNCGIATNATYPIVY